MVMTVSDIVGDIVQIILKDPADLAPLGLNYPVLFLMVNGIDDMGIWVAHPHYVLMHKNDADGKPLPKNERRELKLDANFLLRWDQISTIVHFPNREGYDFPDPYEKHIGFITPEDE